MNKMLSKGKILITYVSVLAILAVSILSIFTGVSFNVFAEDEVAAEGEETVVTYPLNNIYDADYSKVTEVGITYEAVDSSKKTRIDNFTAYEEDFCINPETEGNGTAKTPYIIKTANQFAAVVTGTLKDAQGAWMDTAGVSFKIADDVYGFNLNNTGSAFDFSKDTVTAADVEKELKDAAVVDDKLKWQNTSGKPFMGRFDGNGACVFGLKADSGYSAIFPKAGGNTTIKNLTVKNCYFTGTNVAAFFGANSNPGQTSTYNTKHIMLNCQAYNNVLVCTFDTDEAITKCGILIGQSEWPTESMMVVTDCLVYGNIAKHATRNITYGLVGNLHRNLSLNISSSIVMDSAPHALYYGSNAHLTSSYNSLYTDKIGQVWENHDVNKNGETIKYEYSYTIKGTKPTVGFNHFKKNANTDEWENLTNNGNGYLKELDKSVVYVKTADEIKAATELEGISADKWTYNAGAYPTPKIYRIREYSAGTNWSGEQAVQFGEGDGTETAPFTVATAEELVLMLTEPVTGAHYKLVADIEINDTDKENWTEGAKTWFTSNDVPTFEASLDGNGYTVSGLYYDGTQVGEYAGLIPVIGDTAKIRSLKIANSVIKANKGAAGGIGGTVGGYCSKIIKFDLCVIEDSITFEGKADFAGMVGNIGYSKVQISDCISKSKGFFSSVAGEAKVRRCISVGAYPFVNVTDVIAEGVYTDTAGTEHKGVTVVPHELMLGIQAEESMPGLNFSGDNPSWRSTAKSYPAPTGATESAEGVVGEPWTGNIATSYAYAYTTTDEEGNEVPWVGDGTKEHPYMIETAEQLAYFVYYGEKPSKGNYQKYWLYDEEGNVKLDEKGNKLYSDECPYYPPGHEQQNTLKYGEPELHQNAIVYVKLGADIYLNDLDSKLWKDKVGCHDWFTQRTTQSYNNISHINFDGDGYVIYGLYLNTSKSTGEYVRAGLFPMLGAYSTVENVGISNAYMLGRTDDSNYRDCMGCFMGCTEDFDAFLKLDSHDAEGNKVKLKDEANDYENMAVKFKNCFVDHNCYVSAYASGGFVGEPYSAPILENCIFTGSIDGNPDPYFTGALTGADSTYGTQFRGCIVFPTTSKLSIAGGSSGSSWRSNPGYYVITADPLYYFNLKQQYGGDYTKIKRPDQRFGEEAKEAMPLLDWAGDDTDGTNDYWTVVDGGTPLQTIFAKHRSKKEFEALSCKKFETPEVEVSFVTGAAELEEIKPITGEMYRKEGFVLPKPERAGFEFTGWYVFDDLSIEYPYDYFPPRDLILYAGWKQMGITQDFEQYPDTIWDYDSEYWTLNKPGVKGGYKNKYVRHGSKSMHLLGNKPETSDCLLNYEQMLVPGTSYTLTFWVTTDKANNPPTLLSLVHNSYPDYLDTATAVENMAVVTGLKDGEWEQYSYSFTARTQWVSLRATGNSSLYFDDMVMASLDGVLSDGKVINLGNDGAEGGTLSPTTANGVSVAVLISAIMACAAVAVVSRKNLIEVIED